MATALNEQIKNALHAVIAHPLLESARELEAALTPFFAKRVFGRINQKSSIEAASESDRGVTERLANAFDTSLTAARLAAGIARSDRTFTPRNAAQRFFCLNADQCEWSPQDQRIQTIIKPIIEFWLDAPASKHRFRKHNPSDGLVSVLVRDFGTGLSRASMPATILSLNSEAKLQEFEAIGQFGHGGSSALAFCESCLIVTQPRFNAPAGEFYWTLIFPEREQQESKQTVIRKWFCDVDQLPLLGSVQDFPELASVFPGTSIWHFGYNRGGWIKRIAGPEQSNPWGRLTRLFFSYPLPFEIRGAFARTDTETGRRTVKGAFYRILDQSADPDVVEYRSGEKSERLTVEGQSYGEFSVYVFVFKETGAVNNYVDPRHPVLLTLNGQNHGEMRRTVLTNANLPELASSTIVEVRLDRLEQEALGEIVSNSREAPKTTAFTRTLRERLVSLLQSDEGLIALERKREEEKARQSSEDMSRKMSEFLSRILSDATAGPDVGGGGASPGEGGGGVRQPRPEIPQNDPPIILEFVTAAPFFVAEGTRVLAKFKSDARPPKYSFHGDNPRFFARLECSGEFAERISIVGRADVNDLGYGSVTLENPELATARIDERSEIGNLVLTIQSADGRTVEARLAIGVRPKPVPRERAVRQAVKTRIVFCAPAEEDRAGLSELISEPLIQDFGVFLQKYGEALDVSPAECAYWGEKSDFGGEALLSIEINAGNSHLKRLIQECRSVDERIAAKERYVRDVVLDCYQHSFQIQNTPETVIEAVISDSDEQRRAGEIHFNHDKALRIALNELNAARNR
jgi:hypothetical protein